MRCEVIFDVEKREFLLAELEKKATQPGFWDDQNKAREIIDETNLQRAVVEPFSNLADTLEEVDLLIELIDEEEDEAQRNRTSKEIDGLLNSAQKGFNSLELQSLLSGEYDSGSAYMTLHAGAGGTESCDWADMLLRMYSRYCEKRGFTFETLEYQSGDEAGIKRVTVAVGGTYAYGYLKAERGVHRLVRISPFDSNSRRHTSFAAVDIVAQLGDSVDVEIEDSDLRIDTFRASGAGGQHVNTTDSAVRITHIPTGIVVACQAERSQHMNRAKAMRLLRSKVHDLKEAEKRKDMEQYYGPKGEIAWGSQIRSYVLQPYTMVKDMRTAEETSNTDKVLDGDIQDFIEAYLKWQAQGSGKAEKGKSTTFVGTHALS